MSIDRSGAPFIGVAALVALAFAYAGHRLLALPFVLLALFFVYFFRDPDRRSDAGPDEILSPADGRVLVAGDAEPAGAPPGDVASDQHLPVAGRRARQSHSASRAA